LFSSDILMNFVDWYNKVYLCTKGDVLRATFRVCNTTFSIVHFPFNSLALNLYPLSFKLVHFAARVVPDLKILCFYWLFLCYYHYYFWRCMHRASSYNMYINQQDVVYTLHYPTICI
jgi:hypothetical protein